MRTFLATILSVSFLAVLGVGGYFALRFIIHKTAPLRLQVDDVTAITWLVAFLAASIIAHSINRLREQHRLNRLHSQKTEAYQLFVTLWAERLEHSDVVDPQLRSRTDAEMESLDRLLVACGSPDVINAHAAMRERGIHDPELKSAFAKALLVIRRDLGLSSVGLNSEALLGLLLTHTEQMAARLDPRHDIQPRVSLTSS